MNGRTALIVCATLVIGVLVLTGWANGLGNVPEHIPFSDAWLTAKTKIALFTDARVMGRDINVESAQGLVMIRGNVNSVETKKTAEDIAKGVDGVMSVKNDLQVVQLFTREVLNAKHQAVTSRDETAPCPDRVD